MKCRRDTFALRDSGGQDHRIECDRRCRNHLFAASDVCVLPSLPRILRSGVSAVRIEAQLDSPKTVGVVVDAYRRALDALNNGVPYDVSAGVDAIQEATGRWVSDGPLAFADFPDESERPNTPPRHGNPNAQKEAHPAVLVST